MSGVHKYPTISFRVSPRERDEIEAKITASGMQKKDYFIRSCIYNRVCVVGKKEVVYRLVEELQMMQMNLIDIVSQFEQQEVTLSTEGIKEMRNDCLSMLKAIMWMLDGARYLWQETEERKEKSPDSSNC
ncbi:plasmid mobilization protein [uncultured Robinsoniella sp.]|uniref:plasmid mobilization protein n=1 Tax=Robinsoniella sp. TaxID=2496533 RepID=UPI00374E498F